MTRVVAAVIAHTPAATADFRLVQAINFNDPKVRVELAAAPESIPAAVTEAARAAGAVCTAEADNAPDNTDAEITLPRWARKDRSFSSARVIRFCAASAFIRRPSPTPLRLFLSKNRRNIALRSVSLNPAMASSSQVAVRSP